MPQRITSQGSTDAYMLMDDQHEADETSNGSDSRLVNFSAESTVNPGVVPIFEMNTFFTQIWVRSPIRLLVRLLLG